MSRLPDPQQAIVDHLRRGVALTGPQRVKRPCRSTWREVPWHFADGRLAAKTSVDALIRRGIIAARKQGDSHEAILVAVGMAPE